MALAHLRPRAVSQLESRMWYSDRIWQGRLEPSLSRQVDFGTLLHRVLIAAEVQHAMRGVLAILAVVMGLLALVSAKHAPDGLHVRAEAREAKEPQPGLDVRTSIPAPTFEAARWRALLDVLEQ